MTNANAVSASNGARVLWEDADIAAVYKPAGLMVHPDGKNTGPTLCDFILEQWPQATEVGEPLRLSNGTEIPRPGIVHRIDRETSGVLLVAKTARAFDELKKQFQDRTVRKVYNAFVFGRVAKENGSINMPLGRSKGDFRQYTTPARARGEMREALTYYITLAAKKDFSYLQLIPKTGRTHQLRAHLKAIQHPIVCDRVYAKTRGTALGFERLALHARSVTFTALTGMVRTVEAPLPPDFEAAQVTFAALRE